jgi:hypothetical protein
MSSHPTLKVLTESLADLIDGRRVVAGVFLTFNFDPGFFEAEVLPVVLGIARSHAAPIRRAQVEEALRDRHADLAVYYDAQGLTVGEASAWQDVQRIAVRNSSGLFHAKNLFLLVQDRDAANDAPLALLVGTLSANLVEDAWWRNVEVADFQMLSAPAPVAMAGSALEFLRSVRTLARSEQGKQPALQQVIDFLRRVPAATVSARAKSLPAQFFGKFDLNGARVGLIDWLGTVAGQRLRGCHLEVWSPFFDHGDECQPLHDLIKAFDLAAVRVLLPPGDKGLGVGCSAKMYQTVAQLPGVAWAQPPAGAEFQLGQTAGPRFVHAKLYRFFRPGDLREWQLCGSPNLTTPAFAAKGNLESAVLVEVAAPAGAGFWLEPSTRPAPEEFLPKPPRDDPPLPGGSLLALRYTWTEQLAEAWWDGARPSPQLSISGRNIDLFRLDELPSRSWHQLSADFAGKLQDMLLETSLLTVVDSKGNTAQLLVREEGMRDKPSCLRTLSIDDILRYWSLLSASQKADLLETRMGELAAGAPGSDVAVALIRANASTTLFDDFARVFASFSRMESAVAQALDAKRPTDADTRLFGPKFDTLHTLVAKLGDPETTVSPLQRYVMALCARQSLDHLQKCHTAFWLAHAGDLGRLNHALDDAVKAKQALIESGDPNMAGFLDWFEKAFLARAQSVDALAQEQA